MAAAHILAFLFDCPCSPPVCKALFALFALVALICLFTFGPGLWTLIVNGRKEGTIKGPDDYESEFMYEKELEELGIKGAGII